MKLQVSPICISYQKAQRLWAKMGDRSPERNSSLFFPLRKIYIIISNED